MLPLVYSKMLLGFPKPGILFVLLLSYQCLLASSLILERPSDCKSYQYFDSFKLQCLNCGLDDKDQDNYQQTSTDGLSCICKSRHKKVETKGASLKCLPCGLDEVVSLDGWNCVNCSEDHPFLNETGECMPCNNGLVDEREAKFGKIRYCRICPTEMWPNSEGSRCIKCPEDFRLASNGNCSCPTEKFHLTGGNCIPSAKLMPTNEEWYTIKYQSGQALKSAIFHEYLESAIHNCKEMKNISACYVLANLCVLQLYKFGKEGSSACNEYLKIMEAEGKQWPENSTLIYYLGVDTKLVLSKTNVPNIFSLNGGQNNNKLRFIVASYELNGRFAEWLDVKPGTLTPCQNPDDGENWFQFGVQLDLNCQLSITDILNRKEMKFYELYLINAEKDRETIYPVPILIRNLQKEGQFLNQGDELSQWQLVRRFFLFDTISGIETLASPDSTKKSLLPKVLRYANDISIIIRVDENPDRTGSIFPPLFIISYAEIGSQGNNLNNTIPIHFSIRYKMDQGNTFYSISIALGLLSSLAIFCTFFQTWSWARRSGKTHFDLTILLRFIIFASGNLANVFFLVIFCASLNWLVVYKKQSVLHLLLPTHEREEYLMIYVTVAFSMKCVELIDILVMQCSVNIFFIDWEHPKVQALLSTRRPSVKIIEETFGGETSTASSRSKLSAGAFERTTTEKATGEAVGASIWRAYFMASKWTELQTIRRVNPSLQLFSTLLILKVFGFETLAIADYSSSYSKEGRLNTQYSTICRFAIGTGIYLALAFIQWLIHRIIYERFFEDKLQQFVDLCSVSNISIFIMSMVRFGYYVHGRSTHGKADINMKEMHEHLRREEDDLCSQRGLLPNTEQQTFEMALQDGVNEQCKRLLLPLNTYSQTAERMQGSGGNLTRVDIDRVASTYIMMNKFLSGYIEHAYKDLDYSVKDKLLWENVFDVEFSDIKDRGYFYNDNGHSFDKVLFCGQETSIVLFEALLFAVIDSRTQNFVFAAVVTYLLIRVLQEIRHSAGRRNLVKKALIDERFLC